jgi:NAD(P)-dependent dehydrogenase (short-subunit alcohol dehydrogenase family)
MAKLAGKVAIVTGAAVGMGSEIARVLAREGAAVAANYSRSRREAEATVAAIQAAGGNAEAFKADVADDTAVRTMVDRWPRGGGPRGLSWGHRETRLQA